MGGLVPLRTACLPMLVALASQLALFYVSLRYYVLDDLSGHSRSRNGLC